MAPTDTARPRRLWLVGLIVVAVATGIWASATQRRRPGAAVALGTGRFQLLEFGMGVCEQCRRMAPVMDQARRELGGRLDVHVLDIRQEANEQLAERFGLRAIPLVILVDGAGREVWRHEGYVAYPELSHSVSRRMAAR